MIDTFQLSKTFARSPNTEFLAENGWKPLRDKRTGEIYALCHNAARGECKPRLTLSKTPNEWQILRGEVSLGSWLYNSNLYLVNDEEMKSGLDWFSEYVEAVSGTRFDAHKERVSQCDFTRDFAVGEDSVFPSIKNFTELQLKRYKRVCYDETGVTFRNEGKELTTKYRIYSKHHEMLAKGADADELSKAKGILRFEVSYRKKAINYLVKSLKLESNSAEHILTEATSNKVIEKAMKRLGFEARLTTRQTDIRKLFETCNSKSALNRIGYLYMVEKFGDDFGKLPFVNISQKTLKRYFDDCQKAGVLSLKSIT